MLFGTTFTSFMDFVSRLLNFDDEGNVEVELYNIIEDDFVSNDCNFFIRLFNFLVEEDFFDLCQCKEDARQGMLGG